MLRKNTQTESGHRDQALRRSSGQAMVEFAIAAPLLLLLLFGILEVGRMVFTYSSVVNASREAVRYGSATGYVSDASSAWRYQDCAGIRGAAKNVDFGAGIVDPDIEIYFFNPAGSLIATCANSSPFDPATGGCFGEVTGGIVPNTAPPSIQTGSRILVCTTGHWYSIVPGITGFSTRDMHSRSARTILSTIYLSGGAIAPGPTQPGGIYDTTHLPSDTPTDTPEPSVTPTLKASDTPGPSPTASNTPTATNSPTITDTPTITNTPTMTGTATITPTPYCPVVFVGSSMPARDKFSATFRNDGQVDVTLTNIDIGWDNTPANPLRTVTAGGTLVFNGSRAGPHANISLNITLPAGASIGFVFDFGYDFEADVTAANFLVILNTNVTTCAGGTGN